MIRYISDNKCKLYTAQFQCTNLFISNFRFLYVNRDIEYEFCNAQKIYLYVFKLLDLTYIIKNSPRFINYFSLPVENFPLSQR